MIRYRNINDIQSRISSINGYKSIYIVPALLILRRMRDLSFCAVAAQSYFGCYNAMRQKKTNHKIYAFPNVPPKEEYVEVLFLLDCSGIKGALPVFNSELCSPGAQTNSSPRAHKEIYVRNVQQEHKGSLS